MNEPLVSIIMPCYNGEDYLNQALESVRWQTYDNWECILIDDGSTDGSAGIFQQYAANDARFRYLKQENKGLAAARNTGIDCASGEYIQFLDDDDILLPNRLEDCVDHFLKRPESDVVYSDYVIFQQIGGFLHMRPAKMPYSDPLRSLLLEWNHSFVIPAHAFMFRRDVIAANKFNAALRSHAEDLDCWIRIAASGIRFSYLDETLVVYRMSPQSLATNEVAVYRAQLGIVGKVQQEKYCAAYINDFQRVLVRLRERLAIGHFMEKSFAKGYQEMSLIWRSSPWQARLKMVSWMVLMTIFSRQRIQDARGWIINHTPIRAGGWSDAKRWNPPESLQRLMDL